MQQIKIISILGLCLGVSAQAQTYVNYKITNFDTNGNGSVTFQVPTNTLFKVISFSGNNEYPESCGIGVTYPESTNHLNYFWGNSSYETDHLPVILGPAQIQFTSTWYPDGSQGIVVLLGEFEVVNRTPAIQGFAVQPNGQNANIALQSSVDLVNWCPATNGLYGATGAARFFRMAFSVTP